MFHLELKKIIEARSLQEILEIFHNSTGIKSKLIDKNGNVLISPVNRDDCLFCGVINSSKKGSEKCSSSVVRAGELASAYKQPYIFRCHAGLIGWALPIFEENNHLYTIICCQVMMCKPNCHFWNNLRTVSKELNINYSVLEEAAELIEVLTPERIQSAAELLFIIANYITKTGLPLYQSNNRIMNGNKDKVLIPHEITNRSKMLEKEQELLYKIRLKDKSGAIQTLGLLIRDIIKNQTTVTTSTQNRVVEIAVLISRACVDAGANPETVLKINQDIITKIYQAKNTSELFLILKKAISIFLQEISYNANNAHTLVLQNTINYIRENYQRHDLNLDQISKYVFLSKSYLSYIFKKEFGFTINQYITNVRIEESKKLLKLGTLTINDVARLVGYNNHSYFSKVFKKKCKISPVQYKEIYSTAHRSS